MAKTGKSKQKKMNARVDFTPMVDMIMLLVTFFMLCTTLIKPQTMEIAMPADLETNEDNSTQVEESKAVTLLLDEGDAIYYFEGIPGQVTPEKTTYGKGGVRDKLLRKNQAAYQKIQQLKKEFQLQQSSDPQTFQKNKEAFEAKMKEIMGGDDTPNVIIKATDKATYYNLVDALDEMKICNIGKFMINDFTPEDQKILDEAKGVATPTNQ